MKYIDTEIVKIINDTIHRGETKIRDFGLLVGAVQQPRTHHMYFPDTHPTILAAIYAHGIIKSHPFIDGNKRTALIAALTFLKINGYEAAYPSDDDADCIIAVACGKNEMQVIVDHFQYVMYKSAHTETDQWKAARELLEEYEPVLQMLEDYDKSWDKIAERCI